VLSLLDQDTVLWSRFVAPDRTSYVCVVTESQADIWLLQDFDPDVE
jgi:hypothetical protein